MSPAGQEHLFRDVLGRETPPAMGHYRRRDEGFLRALRCNLAGSTAFGGGRLQLDIAVAEQGAGGTGH